MPQSVNLACEVYFVTVHFHYCTIQQMSMNFVTKLRLPWLYNAVILKTIVILQVIKFNKDGRFVKSSTSKSEYFEFKQMLNL